MLGHKVLQLRLSTHQEKLKAVWELEALRDCKGFESFLGLAVYFVAYIPGLLLLSSSASAEKT